LFRLWADGYQVGGIYIRFPDAIRKWKFIAEDFDDDNYIELGGDVCFVGTTREANKRCEELEYVYEREHGECLSSVTLESLGIMWQGPGKFGGLT
jgi:hypothetical protein